MRYLKKFEAVIMPDSIDDNSVVNSFQSAVEFGLKNNFDVVDYDDFYNSLSEKNKKTAPPRHGIPFFALFNPNNKRIMFVLVDANAPRFIPNFKQIMLDIIGHEKVHSGQYDRRGDIIYNLPDPKNKKEYLSNKDEIMAFSWTIANGLSKTNNNIKDAINDLNKEEDVIDMDFPEMDRQMRMGPGMRPGMRPGMPGPGMMPGTRLPEHKMLWKDIKKYCDKDVIKKYNKYIYMYLDKIFNEKTNESLIGLATIVLSVIAIFKLLKWYLKFLVNKADREAVNVILNNTDLNSRALYGYKENGKLKGMRDALTVTDYNDRWYIRMEGMFSIVPSFRILKEEKILILNAEEEKSRKIKLTDSEYEDFVNIIKEKL